MHESNSRSISSLDNEQRSKRMVEVFIGTNKENDILLLLKLRKRQLLHVGDTCTLFLMPASVNIFGYTPLYTFVFSECLISVEHEGIQPSFI